VVCLTRESEDILDVIKPRPDIKDYYGNLPLFYAIMKNDVIAVGNLFKKGRDYFSLRNYKNETIFHIAAKTNSLEALKIIVDNQVFTVELLKKDYKGDTPLHAAGKCGSKKVYDYFLSSP